MKKKKFSILKLILILLPVLLIGGCTAAIAPLFISYSANAYEAAEIVERPDTYVMPDYPEVILSPEATADLPDVTEPIPVTEPDTETLPPETETEAPETAETETEPAEITAPETDPPETEAPETIDDGSVDMFAPEYVETPAPATKAPETKAPETQPVIETAPPETLAQVVNTPTETETYVIPSNPDASFSNSPNAVSVYGKTPIYKRTQIDSDVINILVMGTDSRDITQDRGRSDTMIVFSYNKKDGTVKMVSFLRDSLIPIEGVGWNRINTAYFYGGVGLAVNTVNQLYSLDIQNFVVIDFNGVKNFIDYIGGVDIELTEEEAELYGLYGHTDLKPGLNHLNANQALMHMRNRDIGSDFARTQRQRQVITAVIKTIVTEKSITEIYDILGYAFNLIKTNISSTDLLSLAASVAAHGTKLSLESQNVPYADAYQNGWYNGMAILSFNITDASNRMHSFLYD
ncbi:MAG: LCP family protein [Clostridia bacterium]|nr:LCP family protein [Clostridia bacterium]